MQRYFLDEVPTGEEFQLPEKVAHHFITVLRSREGSQAEFVLPNRQEIIIAKVVRFELERPIMAIVSRQEAHVELPVDTTIIIGLSKGDKPEWVVQKATELGVHHIIVVETAWSVVHWGQKAAKKITRLNKIATSAAEQAHRLRIPDVSYVASLADLVVDSTVKLVAWEESAKQGETSQLVQQLNGLRPDDSVSFLFGPEGGLSSQEVDALVKQGFVPVGLGPRILRAETAPLYALSTLSYVIELNI